MNMAMNTPTRFDENPASFERKKYDEDTKNTLLKYMKSFEVSSVGGFIDDCVTGEVIKSTNAGYNDGSFMWSSQGIYHFEKYDLAVSPDFVDHVKRKMAV